MNKGKIARLGLVGLGNWANTIANAIMRSKKNKLVTCFTRTPEKRKAFSEKYGCDQEKSYEALLKRDDIDGVILVTPNAVHCEQTVLAAQYAKHVFVDKPIANTIADGKEMIAACQKAGVVLMVGHHMRRSAGFRKLKELIDGGAIGKPIQVEANVSHSGGFALTPEKFRWRGDDSGCPVAPLMTLGIHQVDILRYLLGPIKTVFSFFNKLYIPAPNEDVTATAFQFESGILGYLGSNYASPKALWTYVYGTEANLLCSVVRADLPVAEYLLRISSVDQDTRVQIFEKGKTGPKNIPLREGDPVLEQMDEFVDCIRTGKKPETDGPGGLTALAFVRAAIESARTGGPQKIEV